MLPNDLYANGAQKFAIGSFHDLKFNQTLSQFIGRQKHGCPQCFEVLKILCSCAPDVELR